MTGRTAYPGNKSTGIVAFRREIICRLVLILSLGFLTPLFVTAQEASTYDEISVYINIPYFGVGEIDAVISNEELYLPVTNLFDFLKIRNVPS